MVLILQIILNTLLGYLLKGKIFKMYAVTAFVIYPILAALAPFIQGMFFLIFNGNPDPGAIAIGVDNYSSLIIPSVVSILTQLLFHFYLFEKLQRLRK